MSFKFPRRIAVLLPHARRYGRDGMSESEAAFFAGKEARMSGQSEQSNPHTDLLAEEWLRGYRDNKR